MIIIKTILTIKLTQMPTLIGDVLEQKETPGRMWRPDREEDGEDGVVGVSKNPTFGIQRVPYLKAHSIFVFALAHLEGSPGLCFLWGFQWELYY